MVLIIKRLVPVFKVSDKVPKKWRNLKKAVYVATFKYAYKTIPEILQREYGLKPDEKIVVFWTKAVPRPGWSEWRLPFRKVYSGPIKKFGFPPAQFVVDKRATNGHGSICKECRAEEAKAYRAEQFERLRRLVEKKD